MPVSFIQKKRLNQIGVSGSLKDKAIRFLLRLLSSQNKEEVKEGIFKLKPTIVPEDIIRDPYVLEFLGLNSNDDFYENDLEEALISYLQKFLLELGRGFSFIDRQKIITFDGCHFRNDLVFYNYILKCFVKGEELYFYEE